MIRLKEEYLKIIKQSAIKVFGWGVKIYIFGSRIDQNKRGGDIDI